MGNKLQWFLGLPPRAPPRACGHGNPHYPTLGPQGWGFFPSPHSSFTFLFPLSFLASVARLPYPLPEIFLPTLRQFWHSQRPPYRVDLRLPIPLRHI